MFGPYHFLVRTTFGVSCLVRTTFWSVPLLGRAEFGPYHFLVRTTFWARGDWSVPLLDWLCYVWFVLVSFHPLHTNIFCFISANLPESMQIEGIRVGTFPLNKDESTESPTALFPNTDTDYEYVASITKSLHELCLVQLDPTNNTLNPEPSLPSVKALMKTQEGILERRRSLTLRTLQERNTSLVLNFISFFSIALVHNTFKLPSKLPGLFKCDGDVNMAWESILSPEGIVQFTTTGEKSEDFNEELDDPVIYTIAHQDKSTMSNKGQSIKGKNGFGALMYLAMKRDYYANLHILHSIFNKHCSIGSDRIRVTPGQLNSTPSNVYRRLNELIAKFLKEGVYGDLDSWHEKNQGGMLVTEFLLVWPFARGYLSAKKSPPNKRTLREMFRGNAGEVLRSLVKDIHQSIESNRDVGVDLGVSMTGDDYVTVPFPICD